MCECCACALTRSVPSVCSSTGKLASSSLCMKLGRDIRLCQKSADFASHSKACQLIYHSIVGCFLRPRYVYNQTCVNFSNTRALMVALLWGHLYMDDFDVDQGKNSRQMDTHMVVKSLFTLVCDYFIYGMFRFIRLQSCV